MLNLGDVPAGSVLPILFDTFAVAGESITMSGLAVTDVEIYSGTSMTQRASDNGYALLDTDGIDLDGITGIQGLSVDLGDNSDAGFFAVGTRYRVVVSTITVDSKALSFTAAVFRIVAAESITGYPKVDLHAIGGDAQSATDLKDFADAGYDPATNKVQGVVLVDTTTDLTNAATNGDLTAAMKASVNTEADTALTDYGALKPTTAGRTLDVTAAGNAGIDWGNVENPTTTLNLSGTTIADTQKVDLHTIKTVNVSSAAPGSIRFYGYIGVNSAPGASGGATVVDSIDGVVKASPAPTTTGFDATFAVAPETGVLNDRELQISFAGSSVNQSALPVATYTKIDSTTGRFTFDEAFSITPASSDVVKVMLRHTHPVTQIQDGLGTAAELAKVPKSDGTTTFNATAAAQFQSEAADAITAASLPTLAQILAGGDFDGYTLEQFGKLVLAALAGKLSGAGTATEVFRAADDSKDRITATVDSSGNRTAITLDATG